MISIYMRVATARDGGSAGAAGASGSLANKYLNYQKLFLVWCLVALSGSVFATHEIDHRFSVYGEVKYADGSVAVGIPVQLLGDEGSILTEVETDESGRFRILLHLHNEDLGKKFDLVVAGQRRQATVDFEPEDTTTERKQRFDFTIESP